MTVLRRLFVAGAVAAGLCAPAVTVAAPTMPTDDEIFKTIEEIVSKGPRSQGTPGLDYAVGYVRDQFYKAGLSDVHVEETPTYAWFKGEQHSLTVGGEPVEASAVSHSLSPGREEVGDFATPPGGLDAQLVDGGLGTPAELAKLDVKGKIVVFDLKFILPLAVVMADSEFIWDPEATFAEDPKRLLVANPYQSTFATAIGAIQDAGAAGFVGVLTDYFDSNAYHNELYGSVNVKLPGMWVTKKVGADIRAKMQAEPATRANIKLSASKRKVDAHVVVGYLEGKSKETVIVSSHHDSVWEGAVEDGSGTSEVIALAKYYGAMKPGTREKSLMFATFDSHFTGYSAHAAFATRHVQKRDPERDPHEPVAMVEIEHIAKDGLQDADGKLAVGEQAEPRGIFETFQPALKQTMIDSIVKHDLRRSALLDASKLQTTGMPTDANWALLGGLPVASFISGPNYLYDQSDTLDKVKKDDLQRVALIHQELIDALDTTPAAQIGLPPAVVRQSASPPSVDAPDDKVFGGFRAPPCRPATLGSYLSRAKLRRLGRKRSLLTLHVRRTGRVRIRLRTASGKARTLRARRVKACKRYRLRLRGRVTRARVTWKGGAKTVRRRA